MNAHHVIGKFYRTVDSPESRKLSGNAFLVLLYLYRQFSLSKVNPVDWNETEAEIDSRTLRTGIAELVHHRFIKADYTLLNPKTGRPLKYPKRGQRFENIKTFSFPWRVLDYRRLNASELKVYAVLWSEKNHRSYLSDSEIAFSTGFSETTVRRCLHTLRDQRLIVCRTEPRACFKRIKNKSDRLRSTLADPAVTVIRQISLCDPERPGRECTARGLYRQFIDFREIKPGDVLALLRKLGVRVISESTDIIHCTMPFGRANELRKVDPHTGFSLVPTAERNRKGEPRFAHESVWEMADKYKGAEGHEIVRHWHETLVRRNITGEATA